MVVPLVRRSALPWNTAVADSRMNPVSDVEGVPVVLHPLDMVSVEQLGEQVTSLAKHGQTYAVFLDKFLTRSSGCVDAESCDSRRFNRSSAVF